MTLPDFIMVPAADVELAATQIQSALTEYRLFLEAAVADPPRPLEFESASIGFRALAREIAQEIGVAANTEPDFAEQAWRFNLTAAGLAATNLTARDITQQLKRLKWVNLQPMLAFAPNPKGLDTAKLQADLRQTVGDILTSFMWLLMDATPEHNRPPHERSKQRDGYGDYGFAAMLGITLLNRNFPLPNMANEEFGRVHWRYNTYRIALRLLEFQPAQ